MTINGFRLTDYEHVFYAPKVRSKCAQSALRVLSYARVRFKSY